MDGQKTKHSFPILIEKTLLGCLLFAKEKQQLSLKWKKLEKRERPSENFRNILPVIDTNSSEVRLFCPLVARFKLNKKRNLT